MYYNRGTGKPYPFYILRRKEVSMKKRLFAAAAVLVAFLMLFAAGSVFADFGGFSGDSDYGGDWGGSDSDWGSGWDDDDYSGGSYVFFGPTGGGSCSSGDMMTILIIVIIVIAILLYLRRKAPANPVTTTVHRTDDSLLMPMENYIANVDPAFSIPYMQTRINNLYVQLQDQWCAKDLEPLRPYLTDELYNQSERQLDEIRAQKRTPHVERISVLGTNIRGYFVTEGKDHLIVELNTRISTYMTDDESGAIVQGDPNKERFMTYEWDLCRASGVTSDNVVHTVTNCPNCGAPVNINMTAKCPYCDTIITVDSHDWVLFSIKGLSQRTQ